MAVLSLPIFFVEIIAFDIPSSQQQFTGLRNFFALIQTIFGIYLLHKFRRVLNEFASFYRLDSLIKLMIGLWLVAFLASIIFPTDGFDNPKGGIFAVGTLVLLGAVSIVFGIKLLGCNHNLFGMRTKLAYANIVVGILSATIIGYVFVPIVSVLEYVFFAIMFFRAGDLLTTQVVEESADNDGNQDKSQTRREDLILERLSRDPNGPKAAKPIPEIDRYSAASPHISSKVPSSVRKDLEELKSLFADGLINEADYDKKKSELLDKM